MARRSEGRRTWRSRAATLASDPGTRHRGDLRAPGPLKTSIIGPTANHRRPLQAVCRLNRVSQLVPVHDLVPTGCGSHEPTAGPKGLPDRTVSPPGVLPLTISRRLIPPGPSQPASLWRNTHRTHLPTGDLPPSDRLRWTRSGSGLIDDDHRKPARGPRRRRDRFRIYRRRPASRTRCSSSRDPGPPLFRSGWSWLGWTEVGR